MTSSASTVAFTFAATRACSARTHHCPPLHSPGILNCGVSNIPKMIRAGYLTSQVPRGKAALERSQVEQLAAERARRATEREAAAALPEPPADPRPDTEHDWLTCEQAAKLVGITPQAVRARLRKGKISAAWA